MQKLFEDNKCNEKPIISSLQEKCDYENSIKGNLYYYDCEKCLNRGFINVIINDSIYAKKCSCLIIRDINERLCNSGINENLLNKFTLDNFSTNQQWRLLLKNKCIEYLKEVIESKNKMWLYLGGLSGIGKTHLCISILKELIKSGYKAKYMSWKEDIVKIKQLKKSSNIDNINKYEKTMEELKNINVLYIDDFFKLIDNYSKEEDLNIAYEIINSRYLSDKITIISCEYEKSQLKELDLAIFGRIYEKCGGEKKYYLYSKYEEERNYRIYGDERK